MFFESNVSTWLTPNFEFVDDQTTFENRCVPDIRRWNTWEFDTETTGLDPNTNQVILMQIGTPEKQWVVDTRKVNPRTIKPDLEGRDRLKILHNAVFDYMMMLGSFGIVMDRMCDTMIVEQLLSAGIRKHGFGLDDCVWRYFKQTLDKAMQQSFVNHNGPFSFNQIRYSALDVVGYMTHIMHAQIEKLRYWNMVNIARLECDVIPAFGDIQFYGMRLNKEKWLALSHGNYDEYEDATEELNDLLIEQKLVEPDMFGEISFNWNSQPQLLRLLRQIFPKLKDTNDQTLDTVFHETKHPLIAALRKYRKLSKKDGTYGHAYTDAVHPKTNRLHPRISQLGTDTGRPSCKKPNMLNLPRDLKYREPWEEDEGFVFVTRDYGGCELRIMASASGDPNMCKAFNEGKDLHSFVAAEFTQQKYEEFLKKVEEGDKEAKNLRQSFKGVNFGGRLQLCRSKTSSIQGTLASGNPERIRRERRKRATTHSADRTPADWVRLAA